MTNNVKTKRRARDSWVRLYTPFVSAWTWGWSRVKEPKVISFLAWFMYAIMLGVSINAVFYPPVTIEAAIGGYASLLTAGLLCLGGALGFAAALPGWRAVERLGIYAALAGGLIYLALVLTLHFTNDGNRMFQAGFIAITLISLVSRFLRIREGIFEPGSEASKRAQRKHPHIGIETGPIIIVGEKL